MALMKCPECSRDVSSTAQKCPSCGYHIKSHLRKTNPNRQKVKKKLLIVALLILVVFTVFSLYSSYNKMMYRNFSGSYGPDIWNKQDLGEENGVDAGGLYFFEWKTGQYRYRYAGVVWEHHFDYKLSSDSITIYNVTGGPFGDTAQFSLEGTYPIKKIDGELVIIFNENPQCYFKKH